MLQFQLPFVVLGALEVLPTRVFLVRFARFLFSRALSCQHGPILPFLSSLLLELALGRVFLALLLHTLAELLVPRLQLLPLHPSWPMPHALQPQVFTEPLSLISP